MNDQNAAPQFIDLAMFWLLIFEKNVFYTYFV